MKFTGIGMVPTVAGLIGQLPPPVAGMFLQGSSVMAWTPEMSDAVVGWLRASDLETSDGRVSRWDSFVGDFDVFPQSGASGNPLVDTINGHQAWQVVDDEQLDNNGAEWRTFSKGAEDLWIFAVLRFDGSAASNRTIVSMSTGTLAANSRVYMCVDDSGSTPPNNLQIGGRILDGDTYHGVLGNTDLSTIGPVMVVAGRWCPALDTVQAWINDVLDDEDTTWQGTGAAFSATDAIDGTVGAAGLSGMDIVFCKGSTGFMTVEQRQRIFAYLAHKAGCAADLPASNPYKGAAPVGMELVDGVHAIGHSFVYGSGSSYQPPITLIDGRYTDYDLAGLLTAHGYPGYDAGYIHDRFVADVPWSDLGKVQVLWTGRNSIPGNVATAQAKLQAMVDFLTDRGNDRYLVVECPMTPTEEAAGAGDAGYDAVIAYNQWLAATFPGRVVSAEQMAVLNPDGTNHMTTDGYFRHGVMIGDALESNGWLEADGLPTQAQTRSILTAGATDVLAWEAQPGLPALADPLPADISDQTALIWYKGAGSGPVMGRYDVGTSANRLAIRLSSGKVMLFTGATFATSVAAVNDGNWHLIGWRISNGNAEIIIDGVADAVGSFAAVAPSAVVAWHCCGSVVNGSWACAGNYAMMAVWSAALSPAELLAVYNGGDVPAAADLPALDDLVDVALLSDYRNRVDNGWTGRRGLIVAAGAAIDNTNYDEGDVPAA